jgi:hypothetical protein
MQSVPVASSCVQLVVSPLAVVKMPVGGIEVKRGYSSK